MNADGDTLQEIVDEMNNNDINSAEELRDADDANMGYKRQSEMESKAQPRAEKEAPPPGIRVAATHVDLDFDYGLGIVHRTGLVVN